MLYEKNKFKIKKWLLNHPKINPFNNYFKMYSSSVRLLPNVMVVGFHKTATTSLHEYLIQHPNVIKPLRKEIGYFSIFFWRGEMWYRSHFPTIFSKLNKNMKTDNCIILDSDPNCSYHPDSPKRIHDRLPDVKLIFILRNPIDRAWSDFNQDLNREYISNISFEEKIKEDESDFDKMINSLKFDRLQSDYFKKIPRAYLSIGKYSIYIKKWLEFFSMDQILFLTTDELKSDLNGSLEKVFNFLNIPNQPILDLEKKNVGKYKKMNSETRKKLIEYYKPYNLELEILLNKKFNWNK